MNNGTPATAAVADKSKRKRTNDSDDEESSSCSSCATYAQHAKKKQKLDEEEKKKKTKWRVLVFFDLGCRKGCAFPPKLFCEFSEQKWACFEEVLDDVTGEILLHSSDGDMDCPVSRNDVKYVLKERERPHEYPLKRHLIEEDFGQNVEEEGHRFIVNF